MFHNEQLKKFTELLELSFINGILLYFKDTDKYTRIKYYRMVKFKYKTTCKQEIYIGSFNSEENCYFIEKVKI